MKLPPHLFGKSFVIVAVAIVLYAGTALFLGWDNMRLQVLSFPPKYLLGMGILSVINYLLRFWRWEIYLKRLDCRLSFRLSLGLYFSSYLMVITPGKIGEVFKAGVMREKFAIPLSKGIPIVLAERIYDFLAVLALATFGLFFWTGPFAGLKTGLVVAATIPLFLVFIQNGTIRARLLSKLGQARVLKNHSLALDQSTKSLGILLEPHLMAFSLVLTTVAWFAECLGLWLACKGLGFPLPVPDATFIYAAGTLVGSLSFLPGGLGGTEATIIILLQSVDLDGATAATVALLVRLFTLWLAVAVGLVFFLFFRRELFTSEAK